MTGSFIYDFATVLLFAFLIINFFSKRRQPVVFGYLVAGVLENIPVSGIGPHPWDRSGGQERQDTSDGRVRAKAAYITS